MISDFLSLISIVIAIYKFDISANKNTTEETI